MNDEIKIVRLVSKDGGDYVVRCPHCGRITGIEGHKLSAVQGEQYQHKGCGGWFEVAFNARLVDVLPAAAPPSDGQPQQTGQGGKE